MLVRLVPSGKVLGREYVAFEPYSHGSAHGLFQDQLRTGSARSQSRSRPGHSRVALLLPRILRAADGVLDLAFDLAALAFGGQLGVTEGLAGRFLDGALGLLGRTGDTIFVHVAVSSFVDALLKAMVERPHGPMVTAAPLPSSFLRMTVGSRGMFVGELAMFMSRGRVLLRVVVLAEIVMMGRLMVMMRGGVVVSGRLMVMLTRRMLR